MRAPALVLLCCPLFACATSSLVRPDDATFAAAQQGLADSVHAKVAPAASPDQVLFLQADAFFHYRLSLARPRGALRYTLDIAAAATDFAPLGSAAATGDLLNLRLNAYAGAAQLYEQLLAQYPRSSLGPLALYRLGWVYRSTTVGGFPRDSEQAFAEVTKDATLGPLALEAVHTPYKSQDTAEVLSLVPGAGQIYVGETLNGAVRLSIAAGFAALAILPALHLAQQGKFSWGPAVLSAVGLIGLQVSYTTAYDDAHRAVLQFNEAQEARFEQLHPTAPR